ncbi:MAG: HAD-IIIA family hydrolase [Desulfobacterales bacterium]
MAGKKKKQKVVFLDRDGVINRDSPDYIKNWSEFEFLPGSLEALTKLTINGFVVIVITNQSVIQRKMTSQKELIPEDRCDCRKPNPGLIQKAVKKYNIELKTSTMVGDSAKDIECARNAGCGTLILVKTGNGVTAEKQLTEKMIRPDVIVRDLLEAACWIVSRNDSTFSPDPS